jgi:hypothetical protein
MWIIRYKLGSYFKLSFIMAEMDNLDANLGGYFELSFIMTKLGNLNINFEVILKYLS